VIPPRSPWLGGAQSRRGRHRDWGGPAAGPDDCHTEPLSLSRVTGTTTRQRARMTAIPNLSLSLESRQRARITAIPIRDCALDAATRYGVPCDLSGDEFIIWHDLGMNSSSRGARRDCVPQVVGTAPGRSPIAHHFEVARCKAVRPGYSARSKKKPHESSTHSFTGTCLRSSFACWRAWTSILQVLAALPASLRVHVRELAFLLLCLLACLSQRRATWTAANPDKTIAQSFPAITVEHFKKLYCSILNFI
jgi:hypothetical protein